MAYNLFSPSSYWVLRSHQVNWRFQTSQTQRLHCVEQSHFLVGSVAPVYFSRGPLFSQVRSGVGISNLPLIPLHHQSIQLCPCPRNHSKEDILNFKDACCHKYTSSIIFQTCDNLEKMEIVVNYTYTSNSLPATSALVSYTWNFTGLRIHTSLFSLNVSGDSSGAPSSQSACRPATHDALSNLHPV